MCICVSVCGKKWDILFKKSYGRFLLPNKRYQRPDLCPCLNIHLLPQKKEKNTRKHRFWNTGYQTTESDLWEIGNKQGERCSCAVCCLEFPGCSIGRWTEVDSSRLSHLRRWSWEFGRIRQLEFIAQNTREESTAQKENHSNKRVLQCLTKYWSRQYGNKICEAQGITV